MTTESLPRVRGSICVQQSERQQSPYTPIANMPCKRTKKSPFPLQMESWYTGHPLLHVSGQLCSAGASRHLGAYPVEQTLQPAQTSYCLFTPGSFTTAEKDFLSSRIKISLSLDPGSPSVPTVHCLLYLFHK